MRIVSCLILLVWASSTLSAAVAPVWWKGNLHTHTLWSDGDEFPEVVVEWYRSHGYHFLSISDHNLQHQGEKWMDVAAVAEKAKGEAWKGQGHAPTDAFGNYRRRFGEPWVETRAGPTNGQVMVRLKPFEEYRTLFEEPGRFLLVPGEELTHQSREGRPVHLGAVNLLDAVKPLDGATSRDVIARNLREVEAAASRHRRSVLVHVNHPNYKWGITAEDLASVLAERFFEIWNGVDGDNDPGDALHPSTDEVWDIACTLRLAGYGAAPLYAVAADDAHDYQGNKTRARPGRAWVMVRAPHLTPEWILRALRVGDFYASTGVELDEVNYDPERRRISLRVRPVAGETYVTRFIGTRRGANLLGRPRRDAKGEVAGATLDYAKEVGPRIGEVLLEVTGGEAEYTLTGEELYVRAVVTSTGKPEVPSTELVHKRAWTQPVGWSLRPSAGTGTRD